MNLLMEIKAIRERAEAAERSGRFADAAAGYEALAKSWLMASGLAMSENEKQIRIRYAKAAQSKAMECKAKASKPLATASTHSESMRAGGTSGRKDIGVLGKSDGNDAGESEAEWPEGSLHAQLAKDDVGAMLISQIEGFLRTTGVTWDDVGGQDNLVKDLKKILAQSVMRRPDGSRPDGAGKILMVGPPGTGKTFLVSALANSISGTGAFFDVSLSGIKGHYQGMEEKAIGLLYESARLKAPSLVFIDEVDCISPSREKSGGGAGLGALLAEMDGIKTKGDGKKDPPFVLTVAATNAPWSLDDALLSRFGGYIVLVGAADSEGRKQILAKQLRRYQLETPGLLDWLSEDERTLGFSGRDLQNLVANAVQAMQEEMNPGISSWKSIDEIKGQVQKERPLTQGDFEKAFIVVKASISPKVMDDYRSWMDNHAYRPGQK